MEKLLCAECKNVPNQILKCDCEAHYCADCYLKLGKLCKICNQNGYAKIIVSLRNFIIKCKMCNERIFADEEYMKEHSKSCEGTFIRCSLCGIQGKKNEIFMHFYKDHYLLILKAFGDPIYRIGK